MMFSSSTTTSDHYSNSMPPLITTKWKYNNIEVAPNCPRCASSNTKFCYYNNYSLSQPRYFCKACRRYWTKGGSLRNVPVGGGCRKSRRARAAGRQPPAPTYADAAAASADGSNRGGACIDMAAVFAKYVSRNAEMEESFSTGSSSDNVQGSCTFEEITTSFEHQKALGGGLMMSDEMMSMSMSMPQQLSSSSTCQDLGSLQFVYEDCNGLELQQGVLCDEHVLWSEGTSGVANYMAQQPMAQVEECGVFAADDINDHLRISANLAAENWAAFDLSAAYDFYSTP